MTDSDARADAAVERMAKQAAKKRKDNFCPHCGKSLAVVTNGGLTTQLPSKESK